jgi:hypothetical protein
MKYTGIFLVIALAFTACTKQPGEGGTSSITGKVMVVDSRGIYDPLEQQYDTATYYSEKEDVYIIYGEDSMAIYDDSFETSWDGSYRFEYLRKGKYTLFVYVDNDSLDKKEEPLFQFIEITEDRSIYSLPDFVIHK